MASAPATAPTAPHLRLPGPVFPPSSLMKIPPSGLFTIHAPTISVLRIRSGPTQMWSITRSLLPSTCASRFQCCRRHATRRSSRSPCRDTDACDPAGSAANERASPPYGPSGNQVTARAWVPSRGHAKTNTPRWRSSPDFIRMPDSYIKINALNACEAVSPNCVSERQPCRGKTFAWSQAACSPAPARIRCTLRQRQRLTGSASQPLRLRTAVTCW